MIFRRKTVRKFWLNIHLGIALSIGFIFVVLGLTGSINVFNRELEEIGLPKVTHRLNELPIDLDTLMDKIRNRYPHRKGQWTLYMPGYERNYIWAIYPKPEEYADKLFMPLRVLVNPYTGNIAEENFWGETIWTFIYQLHASMLTARFFDAEAGRLGFKVVCFLGIFFIVSILTGLYLWWPAPGKFRQATRFKPSAGSKRFIYDLHKVAGFYGTAFLLVISFTGFSFAHKDYLKPLVMLFSEVNTVHDKALEGLKSRPIKGKKPISITEVVAIADKVFPYAELRWLATPDGPGGVYAIEKRQAGEANRRRPRSKVWIDQYSGEILAVEDPQLFSAGETFFNLMWPLHNGEAFGLPGRVLWCMTGLAPLILYVTGIMRWLQKRKAAKIKHRSLDGA